MSQPLPSSDPSRQPSNKDEASETSPRASLCFIAQQHGSMWGRGVLGKVPTGPRGPTYLGLGVVIAANGLQLAGVVVGRAGEAPSRLGAVPPDQRCSDKEGRHESHGHRLCISTPKMSSLGTAPCSLGRSLKPSTSIPAVTAAWFLNGLAAPSCPPGSHLCPPALCVEVPGHLRAQCEMNPRGGRELRLKWGIFIL